MGVSCGACLVEISQDLESMHLLLRLAEPRSCCQSPRCLAELLNVPVARKEIH